LDTFTPSPLLQLLLLLLLLSPLLLVLLCIGNLMIKN